MSVNSTDPRLLFPHIRFRTLKTLGHSDHLIGEDGSVWNKTTRNGRRSNEWRKLIPYTSNGYIKVSLRCFPYAVHVLLLTAFIGPRPKNKQALHKNDHRFDNRLCNLYWGTISQNSKDAYRNGRRISPWKRSECRPDNRGQCNGMSKLTEDQVRHIRKLCHLGWSCTQLSKKFNVGPESIRRIIKRERWPHI